MNRLPGEEAARKQNVCVAAYVAGVVRDPTGAAVPRRFEGKTA
jgi:hypothetical protein